MRDARDLLERPCPICAAPTRNKATCFRVNTLPSDQLARLHEDPLWRCGACGFWWIDPPPDLQALTDGYRDTAPGHWGDAGAAETARARGLEEKVAAVTSRVAGGRALDVGCFHGDLLLALPDSFQRFGIELSRAAADIARQRGIHVFEGDAMEIAASEPGAYDVIFCMDTIEHVVDQVAFAERLAGWLAPDGVLVIETGDTGSPMARLMGPRWHYVSLVEHVCAHSRPSLNHLMARVGLAPLETQRRWHTRPSSPFVPARRWAMAAAFRAGTSALGLMRKVVPLPGPLDRAWRRFSPAHPSRDHLFGIYTPAGSRLLRDAR